MHIAKKDDWVEIEQILLTPEQRAPQVTEDTKKTPLKQWIKGYLINDNAIIGDMIEIQTMSGRYVEGILSEVNPAYIHNYGSTIKELLDVGRELKHKLIYQSEGKVNNK